MPGSRVAPTAKKALHELLDTVERGQSWIGFDTVLTSMTPAGVYLRLWDQDALPITSIMAKTYNLCRKYDEIVDQP